MNLSALRLFDEIRPGAWVMAALGALLAAMFGFHRSAEYSLILIGFSLTAAYVSVALRPKQTSGTFVRPHWLPVGSLSYWLGALLLISLGPSWSLSLQLSPPESRLLIAAGVLLFSLIFQGRLIFLPQLPLIGLYLGLRDLDSMPSQIFSAGVFLLSFPVSVLIIMIRRSRSESARLENKLKSLNEISSGLHRRVLSETESLIAIRENLMGTVAAVGDSIGSGFSGILDENPSSRRLPSSTFEDLIPTVRQVFSDFQTLGRKSGKIAGPIRFVFFPPVAGYDEKAEISVDVAALKEGLWSCLTLAHESLPEIGSLRREGVIRLSMRYGFRTVEIAVEDNGRGLQSRNLDAESALGRLKESLESLGGRLDRIARLGVGSRTSLELRILSEKPASSRYRATIRHPFTVSESGQNASQFSGQYSGQFSGRGDDGQLA